MSRKFLSQIVTANDLLDGDNVYFNSKFTWSLEPNGAIVATTIEQADNYLAIANQQSDQIIGAYLIDVHVDDDGRPSPVHFREQFRTRGPSNYFHGKQVEA